MSTASDSNTPSMNGPVFSHQTTNRPTQLANLQVFEKPHREHSHPPLSLASPTLRLTRKRAAALVDTGRPEQQDMTMANSEPRPVDPAGQICLCPPEVKIPRPRNAFMLYRQHFQAAVVAQNPGLANPEISKIIGRQWKREAQEVRDSWDALAEEEKARHLRQYPNYKYQPRRKGSKKPAALDSIIWGASAAEEWCGKCGRRSITTPSTPGTPFTPRLSGPTLPPLASATGSSSLYTRAGYPQSSPLKASMIPPAGVRRKPSVQGPGLDMLHMRESLDDDVATPLTPLNKRRRIDPLGLSPPIMPPSRRSSIQGRMDPPPRPVAARRSPDSSLTLPPLQTTQGKSVEAMVMTISYLNKIKVLSKISPPLAAPGPTSPMQQVRGAIVAVDGEDGEMVNDVSNWLAEELGRNPEFFIKSFTPSTGEADPPTKRDTGTESCFMAYLETIAAWHRVSAELVQFITTAPTGSTPATTRSTSLPEASPSSTPFPSSTTTTPRPIALIPGYMLTRSNQAAVHIPINDAYAPLDHWQWAATLWRGIVGADLTIWIKPCRKEEVFSNNNNNNGGGGGGVEVREDARALIIRVEQGKESIEPRIQRRLAFEVAEWVRSIGKVDGECKTRDN